MAKLPNAEKAIIDAEKLRSYILSATHPVGQYKAAFFQKLGYTSENWEMFAESIKDLINSHDAREGEETQYGKKYVVRGPLAGPTGERVQIVTVWIILKGESVPVFLTAYPGGLS
ncbi:MAG: DUF6883 domain-containing protein [Chloroflexota bacterium]